MVGPGIPPLKNLLRSIRPPPLLPLPANPRCPTHLHKIPPALLLSLTRLRSNSPILPAMTIRFDLFLRNESSRRPPEGWHPVDSPENFLYNEIKLSNQAR